MTFLNRKKALITICACLFWAWTPRTFAQDDNQPFMISGESLIIDPASGVIEVSAWTEVADPDRDDEIEWETTSVESELSNGAGKSATGDGSASVSYSSQVTALGTTYTTTSDHSGEIVTDSNTYDFDDSISDSLSAPPVSFGFRLSMQRTRIRWPLTSPPPLGRCLLFPFSTARITR